MIAKIVQNDWKVLIFLTKSIPISIEIDVCSALNNFVPFISKVFPLLLPFSCSFGRFLLIFSFFRKKGGLVMCSDTFEDMLETEKVL